ncbi:MAG: hypothetical protein JST68_29040 [Bacteroidetes bacterium]|nr:hypothetical protein [Bacteroidota bacterium]
MTTSSDNYFLSTTRHLRAQEEMLIYDRFTPITTKAEQLVGDFLREEYERECLNYPGRAPDFEPGAAIWAARIVFIASQLLLARDKGGRDLMQVLPAYTGRKTAAAILSADLCLRCLPDVIDKAIEISPDDELVPLLKRVLRDWHYSGVGDVADAELDWASIAGDECLLRLYADRVIERKAAELVNTPVLRPVVMAAIGDHQDSFWKEL